jgi:hypothetical protein
MAEYILEQRVSLIETDSKQHTIKGILSTENMLKAIRSYDAENYKTYWLHARRVKSPV